MGLFIGIARGVRDLLHLDLRFCIRNGGIGLGFLPRILRRFWQNDSGGFICIGIGSPRFGFICCRIGDDRRLCPVQCHFRRRRALAEHRTCDKGERADHHETGGGTAPTEDCPAHFPFARHHVDLRHHVPAQILRRCGIRGLQQGAQQGILLRLSVTRRIQLCIRIGGRDPGQHKRRRQRLIDMRHAGQIVQQCLFLRRENGAIPVFCIPL